MGRNQSILEKPCCHRFHTDSIQSQEWTLVCGSMRHQHKCCTTKLTQLWTPIYFVKHLITIIICNYLATILKRHRAVQKRKSPFGPPSQEGSDRIIRQYFYIKWQKEKIRMMNQSLVKSRFARPYFHAPENFQGWKRLETGKRWKNFTNIINPALGTKTKYFFLDKVSA